jgi:hypothetical protein
VARRMVGCLVALLLAGAALGGCVAAGGPTPTPPATIAPAPTATPPPTVPPASPTTAPTTAPTRAAATMTIAAPTVAPAAPTAAPSGKPPALGEPFVLQPGQSASVGGGPTLTFVRVLEDSRCPTRVNCVWSGRAVIALEASVAGQPSATLSLATKHSPQPTDRVPYAGYEIQLAAIQPRPEDPNVTIPASAYRAELVVTRVA